MVTRAGAASGVVALLVTAVAISRVAEAAAQERFVEFYPDEGNNGTNAEFGTAVSFLGDVDGDGVTDVVVGAPYFKNLGAV
jgi:hypothetical protein